MNPLQAIKEAELICRLTEQYRTDPSARLPTLQELKTTANLPRFSLNLEIFRRNLEHLQNLLQRAKGVDLNKEFAAYHPKCVEQTIFGFRAECSEAILYDAEVPQISDFLRYRNCALVFMPQLESRTVLFWDYQDCGRPEGCTRVTDPQFAEEILYTRNFFLTDACCNATSTPDEETIREDLSSFVMNALQNILAAGLAKNGITKESLVYDGYMPMRDALVEFKELCPDIHLFTFDYVIEAAIFAIHAASNFVPKNILLTLIRNIPINVLPDELPDIVEVYHRQYDTNFQQYLQKAKRRMEEVDRLFSDEALFAELIGKLPAMQKSNA